MEVILLERVARLGAVGDVVKVKDGYARNFLIPMKKALRASESNKKLFEERRHIIEEENAKSRAVAEALSNKIGAMTLAMVRQASQEGKLYGSVGVRDVAEALLAKGFDIPKSQIVLSSIIKTTGEFPARLNLHPDVVTTITLSVQRSESDAA